jgi:hypothetical protein
MTSTIKFRMTRKGNYDQIFLKCILNTDFKIIESVRNRVRIDPPHPLVCRKSRLNGRVGGPSRPRVTAGLARQA